MNTEKLELNAVVELFGHQRIAGKVTEQTVGSATFVRIDVPQTPREHGFSNSRSGMVRCIRRYQ